jgi:phosphatidylethanolamine/phosphatidyl-N-methylethanolamine N-methyltransferase
MSLLFFKRVLANPIRVGYIVPSSGFLTRKIAKRMDYSKPQVIVELGPGEGCHTREIVRRMHPESKLILIELDDHFAEHLEKQFAHDERITVIHTDALHLVSTLDELGISDPDYIVSGIPFTIMDSELREKVLSNISRSMGPNTVFITYQFSKLIAQHRLFELSRRDLCLLNFPPLTVMELRKSTEAMIA